MSDLNRQARETVHGLAIACLTRVDFTFPDLAPNVPCTSNGAAVLTFPNGGTSAARSEFVVDVHTFIIVGSPVIRLCYKEAIDRACTEA